MLKGDNCNIFLTVIGKPTGTAFAFMYLKHTVMQNRTVKYFRKNRARKILESPIDVDLVTLLSATFALTKSNIVKRDICNTLNELERYNYRLSA